MSKLLRIAAAGLLALAWAGCGGGSTSSTPSTPSGGGGSNNPKGGVVEPTLVTVGPGQTTQGVDITVPVETPVLNAEALGVANLSGTGSAANVGATIGRGETKRVLIFGKGLSGNLTVTISGPQDVTISNLQSIKATDQTPGVSFTAAVSGSAALGARTVILRDSNDNITAFAGGLEIQ